MIRINGLSKSFGQLKVLNNLDLDLEPGLVHGIVGPNASGKTTLIKIILGLVRPDEGIVSIGGHRINGDYRYRRRLGYMPQKAQYPENLTGKEVLDLIRNLRGNPETTDQQLLEHFRLDSELLKMLKNLSGGTVQKISAVTAFLFNPELIILDEPTAGLDPVSSGILKDKIRLERSRGKTVILTSHIMPEIEELADRIVFLLEGQVVFTGSADQFREHTREKMLERALATMMKFPEGRTN